MDFFNVNFVLNKLMDLFIVRYVKNDIVKIDLELEKFENFLNCIKDVNIIFYFDSDVDRKCNLEFEIELDISFGSFVNRLCIYNSGYVIVDMINLVGFVFIEVVE